MGEEEALSWLRQIVKHVRNCTKTPQDLAVELTNFDSKLLSKDTDISLERKVEINRQVNIMYNIITIRLESQKLLDLRKSRRIKDVVGYSAKDMGVLQDI